MSLNLAKLVRDEIAKLGVSKSAEVFGVSMGTISNWANKKSPPSIAALEIVLNGDSSQLQPQSEPSLKLTMWDGRKVAMLLPVYRSLNANTHFTLFANYVRYGPEKIAVIPPVNRTVIHEGRNMLIDKAMKTDAETFIMSDDDMVIPFGEGAYFNHHFGANLPIRCASHHGISRLMSHGKDAGIVGALYFGRHRQGKAQCAIGFQSEVSNAELRSHKSSGLIETGWVGTGFIKIERWVIERMKAEIDSGRWPECKPIADGRHYGYFTPTRVGVGEDVTFGRRAEEIGIKSYVDADLECLHEGTALYGSHNTVG